MENINNVSLEPGDKIIWNSNSGYEIGYYLGIGNQYATLLVDLITGICTGNVSLSESQIKPYSKELVEELNEKYGYLKEF